MKKQSAARGPVADTGMLIHRPAGKVFDAVCDPKHTTQFWFTHSTGKIQPDADLTWTWEMYGHSIPVKVKAFERNKLIVLEWGSETPTIVEWKFTAVTDTATFVQIINSGFKGSKDEQMKSVIDATGGFTLVLAGLKAWLEFGVKLNLIADRFPKGLENKN
ncbi:SRPBCC family protein [Mucilaginibacter sp. 44-25]|uniref:SRPBCC family protein n=1 Tax=Mucilaginibacter sp. 44-25 TaxID=1895794 RepID=UPI000AC89934|nr:SRPBCC family protein [Mucilaginibacter sp. 44-25]PMP65312.1 MAG: polyketide cyclase [Mucilaginibacter sp.]HEK20080.1 polyketide cyclase [Bacteroidota bacterium]